MSPYSDFDLRMEDRLYEAEHGEPEEGWEDEDDDEDWGEDLEDDDDWDDEEYPDDQEEW